MRFHPGWDGQGSGVSTIFLSPTVSTTAARRTWLLCFPILSGRGYHPCDSAMAWLSSLPQPALRALALQDEGQLCGLGAMTEPFLWNAGLLFSGSWAAFISSIPTLRINRSALSPGVAFHFTSDQPQANHRLWPQASCVGLSPGSSSLPMASHGDKDGAGSLCGHRRQGAVDARGSAQQAESHVGFPTFQRVMMMEHACPSGSWEGQRR